MTPARITITVPNILTVLRILLTPLFAICLLRKLSAGALLVFVAAAVTDALDGLVARLFRQKTTLGAYLDPVADKLLLATAFVTLAVQNVIPSWLTVIVITRDVVILVGVALISIMRREFKVLPAMTSKVTTVAQLVTVSSVLVWPYLPGISALHQPLFWLTAAMTVISGLQYIYRGLGLLQEEIGNSNS